MCFDVMKGSELDLMLESIKKRAQIFSICDISAFQDHEKNNRYAKYHLYYCGQKIISILAPPSINLRPNCLTPTGEIDSTTSNITFRMCFDKKVKFYLVKNS